MFTLNRILAALFVLVIVTILAFLLGGLLEAISLQVISDIGSFLESNCGLIGVLAALVYLVFGYRRF